MIERIAVGRTLDQIAEVPGMPSKEEFLIWLALSPALAQAYKDAKEISAYALEDEALRVLRQLREEAPTQARIRTTQMLVEHLRWTAEKTNPKVYAKQATVNTTVPIQINTNLEMGEAGGGGTKEFPNIYELKAVHTEVVPIPEGERRFKETPEKLAHKRALEAKRRARYRAKLKAKEAAGGRD